MSAGGSRLRWCMYVFYPFALVLLSCIQGWTQWVVLWYGLQRHFIRDGFRPEGQISLGVVIAWTITIARQFALLAGKSAPHAFLQLIIYKVMTFSDEIQRVDTVRAYHVSFSCPSQLRSL